MDEDITYLVIGFLIAVGLLATYYALDALFKDTYWW